MLTSRQAETLEYITAHQSEHGTSPSLKMIAEALALRSVGNVHKLLSGLEDRGFIRRIHGRARAIEVIPRRGNRVAVFKFDSDIKELRPFKPS